MTEPVQPDASDDDEFSRRHAPFTQEQWWRMCDASLSLPVPLAQADLAKPFIYDRKWGVFYTPFGMHQQGMSLLLAFHHGLRDGISVSEKLGVRFSGGTADAWLQTIPGTALRSSQGENVLTATRAGLTVIERRFFGKIRYLFEQAEPGARQRYYS